MNRFYQGITVLGVCAITVLPRVGHANDGPTQFERDVIQVLLDHPEVVLLALEKLREREEGVTAASEVARIASSASVLFEPDKVTGIEPVVVEFFDYLCGFCARVADDVSEVSRAHKGMVRLVEYPILGEVSEGLASLALGVKQIYGLNTYETFHYRLMKAMGGKRSEFGAVGIMQEMGLNKDLVLEIAGSQAVRDEIAEYRRIGRELGVDGTPAFLTKDKLHGGALDKAALLVLIEEGK